MYMCVLMYVCVYVCVMYICVYMHMLLQVDVKIDFIFVFTFGWKEAVTISTIVFSHHHFYITSVPSPGTTMYN